MEALSGGSTYNCAEWQTGRRGKKGWPRDPGERLVGSVLHTGKSAATLVLSRPCSWPPPLVAATRLSWCSVASSQAP